MAGFGRQGIPYGGIHQGDRHALLQEIDRHEQCVLAAPLRHGPLYPAERSRANPDAHPLRDPGLRRKRFIGLDQLPNLPEIFDQPGNKGSQLVRVRPPGERVVRLISGP